MKNHCQKKRKVYVTREFCLVSEKYLPLTRKISTEKASKEGVCYGGW